MVKKKNLTQVWNGKKIKTSLRSEMVKKETSLRSEMVKKKNSLRSEMVKK